MVDHRIGYGQSFNFYQKLSVTNTTFGVATDGYAPDILFQFITHTVMFFNENTGSGKVVEYSFNGFDVHGELDAALTSKNLEFDDRVIPKIWFRVKSGSSGPITIRVDAWSIR